VATVAFCCIVFLQIASGCSGRSNRQVNVGFVTEHSRSKVAASLKLAALSGQKPRTYLNPSRLTPFTAFTFHTDAAVFTCVC